MEYRTLGRTGVKVSPLCLGTMMFGSWGNRDHDDCVRIMHHAFDAGINFVDTADVYAQGESEEIVAKAIAGRRNDVVLATKAHGKMGDGVNNQGNSRRWIVLAVENSLRRLKTDWIDLYQMHRADPSTDIDDTLRALDDLITQGKIRYAGSSTYPAANIVEAQWCAERRNYARFATEQPPYSMLVRASENDVLPVCQRYGMGVLTWSPLAAGWLTGKFRKGVAVPETQRGERNPQRYDLTRPENHAKLDAADKLAALADEAGVSLVHLAIAWVLRHPAVTSAIIGPRTLGQLTSQLGAETFRIDTSILDRIDMIVPPGTNLVSADAGWQNPALKPDARRRP
jgi:aryl-alcohol dehydrogenase-like predicted oxidoreductase